MGVCGKRHAQAALPPGRRPGTYCWMGPQGRSGRVRKNSPAPEFDPRTVQHVARRYTDWATRPAWIPNCTVLIDIQYRALHLMEAFAHVTSTAVLQRTKKYTLQKAMKTRDEDRWLTSRSGRLTPGKETRYPLYRRLGGPQDRSGWVRKTAKAGQAFRLPSWTSRRVLSWAGTNVSEKPTYHTTRSTLPTRWNTQKHSANTERNGHRIPNYNPDAALSRDLQNGVFAP